MFSFPGLIEWRSWRRRPVVSALIRTPRNFSLRELLASLEMHRNRDPDRCLTLGIAAPLDDLNTQALSAAEYEGWPLPVTRRGV